MPDFFVHKRHTRCFIVPETSSAKRYMENEFLSSDYSIGTDYLEDWIASMRQEGYSVEVI